MWPFRRKQTEDKKVPEEVQEYYQAEKRERVGLAWILSIVTLAATMLIVLGLFFGGRWTYRKLTHKNKPVATVQKPQSVPSTTNSGNTSPNNSGSSNSTNNSTAPSTPATPAPNTATQPTANGSSTTNAGGKSSSATPNTGPGSTATFFVIAAALGFGFNELRLHRRLRQDP